MIFGYDPVLNQFANLYLQYTFEKEETYLLQKIDLLYRNTENI